MSPRCGRSATSTVRRVAPDARGREGAATSPTGCPVAARVDVATATQTAARSTRERDGQDEPLTSRHDSPVIGTSQNRT